MRQNSFEKTVWRKSFFPQNNENSYLNKKNLNGSIMKEEDAFLKSQIFSEKKHLYTPYSKLQEIRLVNIGLASPEQIKKWAEKKLPNGKILGQVTNANTLHHKTFKPLKGGLFCERIFGPIKDFECSCGKTKKFTSSIVAPLKGEKTSPQNFPEQQNKEEQERKFCPICDVEYTWSVIRRYQLGYIQLVTPVTHLWYLKGSPSYLSLLLDMKKKNLEFIVYCSKNMTLETINSMVFSKEFPFLFPFISKEKKEQKKFSGDEIFSKTTSSLYNSWEKIVKNLKSKQSLNKNSCQLIEKDMKIASYLLFSKEKTKKENNKNSKPKRLSGWRNLNVQTLNFLFKNFLLLKKTRLNRCQLIPIQILVKLKNLKQTLRIFKYFLTNFKNEKNFYKIAHKKVHLIILKIQIEFLKKSLKEFLNLNKNSSNIYKDLKQNFFTDKNQKEKDLPLFFKKNSAIFKNFHENKSLKTDISKSQENKNYKSLLFNQKKKTKSNNLFLSKFFSKKTKSKTKKNVFIFSFKDKPFSLSFQKEKTRGGAKQLPPTFRKNLTNRLFSNDLEKIFSEKMMKFLLRFRIQKEILNSEFDKTLFSSFYVFLQSSANNKTSFNFSKKRLPKLNTDKSNKEKKINNFFQKNLNLVTLNTKNSIVPTDTISDYLEKKFVEIFLFNFLKKKDVTKEEKNKKTLKFLKINTFNSILKKIQNISFFEEKRTKKNFFNNVEKKDFEKKNQDFFVLHKSNLMPEFVKSKESQNYSLYCLSHRFCWENEKDWSNFVYFFSGPTKIDDIPIFTYKERIPNTFNRPFSGAKVLQKLLTEFHFQEFRKMDRQNRILLYELNKEIQKDYFKFDKVINLSEQLNSRNFQQKDGKPINLEKKQWKRFSQKRDQLIRRTKFIRKLFRKNSQPESMILSVLPVLPPDLRPILKIQDQIAASDLNRLYQRVLYRNERLKKFLKDSAMSHSYEMKYAQRLLQEAVDNLLQNGKAGGTPERDSRGRLLKSLSEILKGKQGRFRQHLLGKRVDYSGRSVIVVGPQLKIHECGLPKEMALELFLPFLLKRLIHSKMARTVIGAKTILKDNPVFTWEILHEVMQNYPVLLNRAPTLHRLGIQAFQPKLVEGRAILLHPLVCPAFNADFDGDQMAVHIPLTVEARTEAWKLMCSGNHFFSPATGDFLLLPSQDMVLGCYYLTTEKKAHRKKNFSFLNKKEKSNKDSSSNIVSSNQNVFNLFLQSRKTSGFPESYNFKKNIHQIIWIKWDGSLESIEDPEQPVEMRINSFGYWNEIFPKFQYHFHFNGLIISQFIRTTVGRLFFNEIISLFSKKKKNF